MRLSSLTAAGRIVRRTLWIAGGLYLVLAALLWLCQRQLIYLPAEGPVVMPQQAPLDALHDVRITTADGVVLAAWHLPSASKTTILVFHGNAGHRGHRTGLLRALHRLGHGVLLPDYRGYGGSEGEPSEAGLYADAEACRAWLAEHAPGPVVYLGNSLGSGVAVELARRHAPAALIVRSGFDALGEVGQHAYPFLPVRWLLRDEYASADKMKDIACPLLVVHGEADRIVPILRGKALFDAAHEPKHWLALSGIGHNDVETSAGPRYWAAVRQFLTEHGID